MSAVEASLLAGVGVGLSIAIPFGPTSLYLIERTLSDGVRTGIATGLGVATVHVLYSMGAVFFGVALVADTGHAALLTLMSGLVLAYFSVRVWNMEFSGRRNRPSPLGLTRTYFGAVGFGFLNPLTPALCGAAVIAANSGLGTPGSLLIPGIFAGSVGWWITLSVTVSLFRKRLDARWLALLNRTAGLFLAAFALAMVFRSVNGLALAAM